MRKSYFFGVVILITHALCFADSPREDAVTAVKTAEKTYTVQYTNGNTDRFVYVFTAYVSSFMQQDGKSSSFGHPTDSRRCNYKVGRYIRRDGYYLTGSGSRVPLNDVQKIYGPSSGATFSNSVLENVFGQHSPCNDHVASFNQQKQQATAAAVADFDKLMLSDVITNSVKDAEAVTKATFKEAS